MVVTETQSTSNYAAARKFHMTECKALTETIE